MAVGEGGAVNKENLVFSDWLTAKKFSTQRRFVTHERWPAVSIVYTIGYEGTDIERFVATLKHVGVMILADVRAVANSRKKGFSKSKLRARLAEEGITYTHYIELGDPKPGRDAARAGNYDRFRRIYSRHLAGADPQAAIEAIAKIAQKTPTCLLCFERDPKVCHRSMIADELVSLGLKNFDLFGDNPNQYVRHSAKLPRRNIGQGATAA